jgi:hypothetical protein
MKFNIYDALLSRLSNHIMPRVVENATKAVIAELNGSLAETLRRRRRRLPLADRRPSERKSVASQDPWHVPEEIDKLVEDLVLQKLTKLIDDTFVSKMLPHHLTKANVYIPNRIVSGSGSGQYMQASNPLTRDFFHPEFKAFCETYFEKENLLGSLSRKNWEWAFIYHHLNRSGVLAPGLRGVGFGVGREKLPAIFASKGAEITATDAPFDKSGWVEAGTYCRSVEDVFYPDVIDRDVFDRLVHYESCDMNNISNGLTDYDFCWSSCALEHLGNLERGIEFIMNSIEKTLRIGGIACHTTELNLSSDLDTFETVHCVLYRKQDLERVSRILEERGHSVEPLRIEPGDLPPDYLVDVPPYSGNPHLKLSFHSYVATSVGVVARRGR